MGNDMIPLISIGPFTLYFFGLMIGIGAIVGLLLAVKEAKRRGLNHNLLTDGILYSIIAGVIGARIVYIVIYNPVYYFSNPIEIFAIHQGGLSIHGGILGGLLFGIWFMKRHKMSVWQTLDLIAPSLILAQGISRIGCDVFGGPILSSLPWGIEKNGQLLHPAQAYEFLLDYLLFGYLWLRLKKPSYHGQIFIHYIIGFMTIRGIVEFVRINPMVVGPFSVSHIMSFIGILIASFLMMKRRKDRNTNKTAISKSDYIKIGFSVIGLMIVSLTIYYLVQG